MSGAQPAGFACPHGSIAESDYPFRWSATAVGGRATPRLHVISVRRMCGVRARER